MDAQDNPYASPTAELEYAELLPASHSEAEHIRRMYLKHEASVKSVGLLYYCSALFLAVGTLGVFIALLDEYAPAAFGLAALYLVLSVASFFVGRGLRQLDSRVRLPVGIFSGLGLLMFPMGTIINGYILYLVFSEKGRKVFSPGYREVMEQTPHIKYKSSMLALFLLALIIAVLAVALVFALIGN